MLNSLLPPLIIFVAFFCESVFGFGGGFISIPLSSVLLGPKTAVTFVLVFQLLMGLMIFWTYKDIYWKIALPMTVSVVAGSIIGAFMLSAVDENFLRKFLAFTILLFLTKMLFFPKITIENKPTRVSGFITGLIGGWFQGITGTSSPIFTMYLTTAQLTKSAMRSTLIYIFFISSVFRVIVSYSQGLFTPSVTSLILPAFPLFILALFLGHHVHKKLNEKVYQYTIYVILFFSAILLLVRSS